MTEYGRIHTDGSRSGGQPVIKTQHCPNCEATEQKLHDFRQEVSDAVELSIERCGHDGLRAGHINEYLGRFIITEPDPLVKVLNEISHEGGFDNFNHYAHRLRAALNAAGFEIREK